MTSRARARSRGPPQRRRDPGDDAAREDEPQRRGRARGARQRLRLPAPRRRPTSSDDDVYVSGAQVRRCELVAGDRVSGPVRRARRSERHPSLVRVSTINGVAAEEVSDGTRYVDLGAAFPSVPMTLQGQGRDAQADRRPRADRPRLARDRRAAPRLGPHDDAAPARDRARRRGRHRGQVVLAGARPEELAEWTAADLEPERRRRSRPRAPTRRPRPSTARSTRPSGSRPAEGTRRSSSTRSISCAGAAAAARSAAARNVPDGGTLTRDRRRARAASAGRRRDPARRRRVGRRAPSGARPRQLHAARRGARRRAQGDDDHQGRAKALAAHGAGRGALD